MRCSMLLDCETRRCLSASLRKLIFCCLGGRKLFVDPRRPASASGQNEIAETHTQSAVADFSDAEKGKVCALF